MVNVVLGLDAKNQASLIKAITLGLIAFVAIASRLFSIIRFESVIHEFDPWFNYRATKYLVSTNFYEFWNWFDERSWYPLGRVVGGTVFPGLMVTSATIYNVLHSLNFPVDIRNICVLLAPLFSAFTAYAAYLLTAEIKDSSAGLLAAAFIGVVPEDCYWALLSRKDFSFLYLSPWLSNNLKNESSDLLLGTSLFDYFRPDEKMLAQKDLTRVNNNKLSLSITR
ncbi:17809_t:CDS:2 [Entrophospora sp. SA101]|nr:17809_t:CDS:2 [Entrophospora sp. SA101]